MILLSVIIITKNEAHNIERCLQSVQWAAEIIVVDSGSTDQTVTLAQQLGATVYQHDWPGFGPQKNRALAYARYPWVLSLDADEFIEPALQQEIQQAIQQREMAGFYIPRLSSFCGRYMKHSGWRPDYVLRLFVREQGRFTDDLVHEQVKVEGTTGRLKASIYHESLVSLEQTLQKMNDYSTQGARMQAERGRQATLLTAVCRGGWAFFRTYILRAGFLDGVEGFMLAVTTAEGTYYRYLKLMLLTRKRSSE